MSFNMEIMAEIAFTKLFKLILSFGYWGTGVFFFDQLLTDGEIINKSPIPTPLQNIAAAMFVAMTAVKIVWTIYEKFFIERKERFLKMENDMEDLNQKKKNNRNEKS